MTIQHTRSAAVVLSMVLASAVSADADDQAGLVTTVPVPGGGRPVVARTDRAGTIHLLFDSPAGPKYTRSTDDGATFSPAITVVNGDSRPAGLEKSAWYRAVGNAGGVQVAMTTNRRR